VKTEMVDVLSVDPQVGKGMRHPGCPSSGPFLGYSCMHCVIQRLFVVSNPLHRVSTGSCRRSIPKLHSTQPAGRLQPGSSPAAAGMLSTTGYAVQMHVELLSSITAVLDKIQYPDFDNVCLLVAFAVLIAKSILAAVAVACVPGAGVHYGEQQGLSVDGTSQWQCRGSEDHGRHAECHQAQHQGRPAMGNCIWACSGCGRCVGVCPLCGLSCLLCATEVG